MPDSVSTLLALYRSALRPGTATSVTLEMSGLFCKEAMMLSVHAQRKPPAYGQVLQNMTLEASAHLHERPLWIEPFRQDPQ